MLGMLMSLLAGQFLGPVVGSGYAYPPNQAPLNQMLEMTYIGRLSNPGWPNIPPVQPKTIIVPRQVKATGRIIAINDDVKILAIQLPIGKKFIKYDALTEFRSYDGRFHVFVEGDLVLIEGNTITYVDARPARSATPFPFIDLDTGDY